MAQLRSAPTLSDSLLVPLDYAAEATDVADRAGGAGNPTSPSDSAPGDHADDVMKEIEEEGLTELFHEKMAELDEIDFAEPDGEGLDELEEIELADLDGEGSGELEEAGPAGSGAPAPVVESAPAAAAPDAQVKRARR